MNVGKLQRLLLNARSAIPPVPSGDFNERVIRAIRREQRPEPFSLIDQLGEFFPRLGLAAVVLIALCAASDLCFTTFSQTDLTSGVAQLSDQWLFAAKGD